MTDRFVTVPDSLELPPAVKVPVARLIGPTGAAATPADLGAATAAQGELAATAVQPGDLGNAAGLDVGTTAGTVKAGDWQPTAADVTDSTAAGRALLTGADAAAQRSSLDVVGMGNDRARAARANSPRWSLASDTLAVLTSSGLTLSGAHIVATQAGTYGNAVFPIWRNRGFRVSFRVVATKSTAGSISGVGFTTNATPTSIPSGSDKAWIVGYVQGFGIAVRPYNVSSDAVTIILVADSAITDGDVFDVSFWMDPILNRQTSTNNGTLIRVVSVATGTEYRRALNTYLTLTPTQVLVRTNAATPALTNVEINTHPGGPLGLPTVGTTHWHPTDTTEYVTVRAPATPNGKLVFAMHGHGSTGEVISRTSYMMDSWTALTDAGFTVAFPDLSSNAHWSNDNAMTYLALCHQTLIAALDLDPEVYMYGISMGGGASLTAIAKKVIPIRAAYLAHPSCDMRARWADPATWPTLRTAYGDVEADMLDNNPWSQSTSAFAGVPLLFTASPDDTTTPKDYHTDAFRTKLGAVTPNYLITATGNHMDPSHFRARDALNFFRANI